MRVVILDVVVVGLIKNSARVVVAVGILVPDSAHLIHDLGLCRVWTKRNCVLATKLWCLVNI
jgi:hypothetical protein